MEDKIPYLKPCPICGVSDFKAMIGGWIFVAVLVYMISTLLPPNTLFIYTEKIRVLWNSKIGE